MLLVTNITTKHSYLIIACIVLLGLLSVVAINRVEATPAPPSLPGLTAADMAFTGIAIAPPSGTPALDQATALQSLPLYEPNAQVLKTVLADYTDTHLTPPVNCLCYVVAITPHPPPSSPDAAHPLPAGTFELVIMDANTGAYIETVGN